MNALDRLNPVTRLALALVMAIPVIVSLDWLSASILLIGQIVVFLACGFTPTILLKRLWPVAIVAPLGALSMALYGKPGGETYWHWGLIHITERSTHMAGSVIVRILALGLSAVMLLGSLDLTATADGLAQRCHLPARFVLGALAGMRMTNLFIDDWRTLSQARRARGLGDTGRLRRLATMLFAMLVFAIRRGTRLATAMESRGFSNETAHKRTWARPSHFHKTDLGAWVIALFLVTAALFFSIFFDTFTPITQ